MNKKLQQKTADQKSVSRTDISHEKAPQCSSCNSLNESEAKFCEQCGTPLTPFSKCPNCGAQARPNADICEICGEWLLKGQCMFCYASIDEGTAFCGNCGNPTTGITCQQCGRLSRFDFCKSCNLPLTLAAREMIQECANDPVIKELSRLCTDIASDTAENASHKTYPEEQKAEQISASHQDELSRLKAYREMNKQTQTVLPRQKPKTLFSNAQKEKISLLDIEIAEENEKRRIEEERRRQEEERKRRKKKEERKRILNEKLDQLTKTSSVESFGSQQEARKYFMSILVSLPEAMLNRISKMGWRCNAYDTVHKNPCECADPSQGGVWLFL